MEASAAVVAVHPEDVVRSSAAAVDLCELLLSCTKNQPLRDELNILKVRMEGYGTKARGLVRPVLLSDQYGLFMELDVIRITSAMLIGMIKKK